MHLSSFRGGERRSNTSGVVRERERAEKAMEEVVFGEGWLDGLLSERQAPRPLKERVREALQEEGNKKACARRWREVGRLLGKGEVGRALEEAMASFREAVGTIEGRVEVEEDLAMPFSPFLAGEKEIREVLQPPPEWKGIGRPLDDLEALRALAFLNLVRRLMASWGAPTWKGLTEGLLRRLDGDLEELRRVREELGSLDEEDLEAEADLADHYAGASSRFARDLFQLHLLNARHPEVGMRFRILWEQVEQLIEDRDFAAAAQEAFSVLEEAFDVAGLGGGDLLEMVDILYDYFSDPEELRRVVDAMAAVRRGAGGSPWEGREGQFVDTVKSALEDMGLLRT